jgi:gamma-glutamyl-gamma-aminobutyrate hydrolase PuuD
MHKVFIPCSSAPYEDMFLQRGWEIVHTVEEADLVQFTGGSDVFPALYGEKPIEGLSWDSKRDYLEMAVFRRARRLGKPMAGICRGGQFLHVMCGGSLAQDTNGHATPQGHEASCKLTGEVLKVTSTHHQMMKDDAGEVILEASEGSCTYQRGESGVIHDFTQVEGVFHEKEKVLCFQPHPEMCRRDSPCQEKYFKYVRGLLCLL